MTAEDAPDYHGAMEPGRKSRFGLNWMLPAGVAIAVAVGVATTPHQGGRRAADREGAGSNLTASPMLLAPEATAAGQVRLRWSGVPEADAYLVSLLDEDSRQIRSLGSTRAPELLIDPADVPPARASGTLLWRVVALRQGQVVARSDPAALRLP